VSKAVTPRDSAREMMALQGREETSVLYWLLKVAVPQIRGVRMVERGGWVGGILRVRLIFEAGELRRWDKVW
jgi:hypothetical protein